MSRKEAPESPVSRARSRSVKRTAVLNAARSERRVSRAGLVELTGLSAASITHLVRELIDEGYLAEAGAAESRGGRPQSILEFRPDAELVVVVDLRRGRVETVLADWDGTPVAEPVIRPLEHLVDDVVAAVAELTAGHGTRVKAVSVAIPGVAAGSAGQVRLAPAIGLLDGQPLGDHLRDRIGLPVVVDNDVNLMVVGEHVAGAAQDVDDVLLMYVGDDGIGSSLMIEGRVRQGASGVAGEIGFLPLGAPVPPVDGVGGFERAWSAEGVARQAGLPAGTALVPELERRAGSDPRVAELLDGVARHWAHAVVAAVCVVDPGRVLLGGAASELGPATLAAVTDEIARLAPGPVDVRIAALGSRALLHGAVRRAFDAHDSATPAS